MRLYQESPDAAALPPIRTVVIDGVMPTTLNQVAENPVSEQLVALRVFADCEADAACGAAFPNIRQRTINLLDAFQQCADSDQRRDNRDVDRCHRDAHRSVREPGAGRVSCL